MEQHKRQYLTEIQVQISRTEKAQERDRETLKELPYLVNNKEIVAKKTQELNGNIYRRITEIEILQKRYADMSSGLLDQEITQGLTEQKAIQTVKNSTAQKKKKDDIHENEDKRTNMFSKQRKEDDRQLERDKKYFYKQYCKIVDSIPEYMAENLKTMPNNKGYLFRQTWLLGSQAEEPGQPTVLFEKVRGVMKIHEYDQWEYRLYEKVGKEKKKLVLRRSRKIKKSINKF